MKVRAIACALSCVSIVAGATCQATGADAASGDSLGIEVRLLGDAREGEIPFGAPFELEVVRTWPRGVAVEPWSDDALAPLRVEAEGAPRIEADAGRIVERRRFRAWAFRRGAVILQPENVERLEDPTGEPRRATAPLCTLFVESVLAKGDAGVPELPPEPSLEVVSWSAALRDGALWALGAALAVLAASVGLRWRRRRRQARTDAPGLAERWRAWQAEPERPGDAVRRRERALAATVLLRDARRRLADHAEPDVLAAAERARALLEVAKFGGRDLSEDEHRRLVADLERAVAAAAAQPIAESPR